MAKNYHILNKNVKDNEIMVVEVHVSSHQFFAKRTILEYFSVFFSSVVQNVQELMFIICI